MFTKFVKKFGLFSTVISLIIVYNISRKSEMVSKKYFTAIRKAVYKSTETKYFTLPVKRVIKAQEQNKDSSESFYIMREYD